MKHPEELAHRDSLAATYRLVGKLDQVWREAIRMSPYADEWDAYRKHEAGEKWPDYLELAYKAYIQELHRYYLLRDGPDGFLGGKGL